MVQSTSARRRTRSLVLREVDLTEMRPLENGVLVRGLSSGLVRHINGLDMHVLEAGLEGHSRPLILLLHGFPELAYSWRKVMLPLAAAGYRVVGPDQRAMASGITRHARPMSICGIVRRPSMPSAVLTLH
jgi:alpha/beta hydrolase fold